ncbi:BamA/TamA family outer membrane protein [Parahaliea aestuarii]|uniref:BamA/TamA family outer membrane protein n=1 Tax=Parahaliea aestuarii TaxID=1852021 RepID=A0A5C9A0L7_9GAMM|nr:BamA/TamA family outer membrane protein [Parahaliea aestuarii]TXS93320.1 BamA/TamA family outer membrane protein [Parahaliea aestuarii]
MTFCRRACALPLLLCAAASQADDFFRDNMIDPEDGMLDASQYLSSVPLGFLPIPSIITEPAVGTGLAMGALFFHETAEQRKQRTSQRAMLPENISVLGGMGTDNGTWGAGGGHLGFWLQDSLRYRGFVGYASINLDFYSLPRLGDLPRPLELNLEGPALFQDLKYRLPGTGIFIGGRQFYRQVETSLANAPRLPNLPPGFGDALADQFDQKIATSGLGAVVEYDSRDNPFNPQQGYYYTANYTVFDGAIGSDVDYDSYQFAGLNYWELNERWNLGVRLQYDAVRASGNEALPSYVPPFVDLRGIPKSRYQGEAVGTAEVQLDYKINMRWKVGVFSGMGRAAEHFNDLGSADNVDTIGAGFRYLIARRYGFAMGLDVARGPEESAVYIQAGSTW